MSRMRNLTLASAKHLLSQGHITPQHHARIIAAATLPKMPKMPKMAKPPGFGQLAAPVLPPQGLPGGLAPAAGPPRLPPGIMPEQQ